MVRRRSKSRSKRKRSGKRGGKTRSKSKRKRSGKSRIKSTAKTSKCKQYLQAKIEKNLHEWKHEGKFSSRSQAIAVAYSQVKKAHPACKRYF